MSWANEVNPSCMASVWQTEESSAIGSVIGTRERTFSDSSKMYALNCNGSGPVNLSLRLLP
ncbi:hypothetical protein FGIG_02779 [Fasciola gigantica]|uniref:Uncharacterized protein n=1 Tax=Fasciola gigantica TaxID=46835 RepID=A0A504YY25_FASGI|nr:hypothetical protein FGIG_02779 [Fasciola gigantica]